MEAIHSSETPVYTKSTQRHIPEDGILQSHRCENLKSDDYFYCYGVILFIITKFYICKHEFKPMLFALISNTSMEALKVPSKD
jgi:hypothetical protein